MQAGPRLDRRLLVGAEHELARVQQLALEAAGVEVEHPRRLRPEVGVAREDPGAVVPGADRSSASQRQTVAPDTCSTIPRATASRAISALLKRESGTPALARQLAGDRLHLGHRLGGKSAAAALLGDDPPAPAAAPRGSACASGSPPPSSYPAAARSRRSRAPRQPAARSSLAAPPGRPASAAAPAGATPRSSLSLSSIRYGVLAMPTSSTPTAEDPSTIVTKLMAGTTKWFCSQVLSRGERGCAAGDVDRSRRRSRSSRVNFHSNGFATCS